MNELGTLLMVSNRYVAINKRKKIPIDKNYVNSKKTT